MKLKINFSFNPAGVSYLFLSFFFKRKKKERETRGHHQAHASQTLIFLSMSGLACAGYNVHRLSLNTHSHGSSGGYNRSIDPMSVSTLQELRFLGHVLAGGRMSNQTCRSCNLPVLCLCFRKQRRRQRTRKWGRSKIGTTVCWIKIMTSEI